MRMPTKLESALLGLLLQKPMSGYDLRKMFTSSPMGHFSDSPGTIYPALNRLEGRELISGKSAGQKTRRQKKTFTVTQKGRKVLKSWISMPITRDAIMRQMDMLMLRFAFMGSMLDDSHTRTFLAQMELELSKYVVELKEFFRMAAPMMPLHGRLAMNSGIDAYSAHLRWARKALIAFSQQERETT